MGQLALTAETSRGEALAVAARVLGEAGIAAPRREAALLLRAVLALGAADRLGGDGTAIGPRADMLQRGLERRARHEPLSRILGRRAFWTLELEISPATLDPRPETELLVEVVRDEMSRQGRQAGDLRILDLGTGSGAILLALLAEFPNARGLGTDVSAAAVGVARRNGAGAGAAERATFSVGSWLEGISGPFDVIVSNPPYVPTQAIDALEPAVRCYDPRAALDGGADGLAPYRIIVPAGARLLAPHGIIAVEIGESQGEAVDRLMHAAGLAPLTAAGRIFHDLAGRPRCVAAKTYPAL